MIARTCVLLAAVAAALGLASAGGWGVDECSEMDRDRILDLAEDCRWAPFASKQSEVAKLGTPECPDGCACSGLGNSTVLIGRDKGCLALAYAANGKSVSAAEGCAAGGGCRCFADKCAYSCEDTDGRSCLAQFDGDQDERSDIKKFFTAKNIAIFSGAGAGVLLVGTCLLCVCCCCMCRNCSGMGSDKDSGF